jgi:hypothetical protein
MPCIETQVRLAAPPLPGSGIVCLRDVWVVAILKKHNWREDGEAHSQ